MRAKITDRLIKGLQPQSRPYEVCDTEIKGFRLIVWPSGSKSFIVRYRNAQGRKKSYTIGKHGNITTTKARKQAEDLSSDARKGVDIQAEKQETRRQAKIEQQRTLGGFIDAQYGDWLKAERKTGEEILNRLEHHFKDWYDKPLTDINPWLVTNWRTQKLKTGARPATVNRVISSLKALLSKAVEWEVILSNPLASVKPLKLDKSPSVRYLSDDEDKRLRDALDQRQAEQRAERARYNEWRTVRHLEPHPELEGRKFTDHLKPLVLIALNTGMRQGELFNLTWVDVNLKMRTLTVQGGGAKSGNTRHIPLNDEAFNILVTWGNENPGEPTGLVFPSPVTGKRLDNIKKSWKALLTAAKIQNFRFHDLRHTFASYLVMRGVDLYTVKELLGHSSIEMTQRYAHLAPEHKAAAVALLDRES